MMNEAHVFFSGYVATDPVYWPNQDGNSKAQLRVAYTPRHVDRSTGEWTDSPTSFVTVFCWRKLADNVALCLRKGEPVVVRGRMQVRQYDDRAGKPRVSVDVDASAIGHDLAKGVALFQRTRRPAGETAAAAGADAASAQGTDGSVLTVPAPAPAAPAAGAAGGPGGGLADGPGDGVSDDVLDDRAVAALTADPGPAAGDGVTGDGVTGDGGAVPGDEAPVPV